VKTSSRVIWLLFTITITILITTTVGAQTLTNFRIANGTSGENFELTRRLSAPAPETTASPEPRPQYGVNYYGAFVFDPDGYNFEAVCREAE